MDGLLASVNGLRHQVDHLLLGASVFAAGYLTRKLHQYHGHTRA